ncbi:MAG: POTRA domain-containing protein [Chitinophagaceae bacterium]
MLQKRPYFLLVTLMLFCVGAQAQLSAATNLFSTDDQASFGDSLQQYTLKAITITGNKLTRRSIILREVAFREEEQYSLSELVRKFGETKRQLMNTGLFREVVVSLQSMEGKDAFVEIKVKERWYVYPIPFARLVDRSFDEWVIEKHMSLTRINYGVKLTHRNTTGRNDQLYIYLMNGYTKQLSFRYDGLYLDKGLHWSTNFGFSLGKVKELVYATENNKLLFYKHNDQFVNSFFRTAIEFSYRRAIKTRHTFGLGYNYENVTDTVFKLNPFYSEQKKAVRYPEVYYRMNYTNVDFLPYPTKGYVSELGVVKKGLLHKVNLWQLTAKGSATWPVMQKYFVNLRAAGVLKLPFKQPYVTNRLLGYDGMLMQGYEYYVIDGVAGGYGKAALFREVLNRVIRIPSNKFERINNIPIKMFAKIYGNTGYAYNPEPGKNYLCNRFLYSSGVGLDIILFNDFVIKLEWSANRLGEKGLYLHRRDYF